MQETTITLDYGEYLKIKEEIRIINEKLEKTPCMIIKDSNHSSSTIDIRYIPFYNHLGEFTIRHPSYQIVSENQALKIADMKLKQANDDCKQFRDLYFDLFDKVKSNPICRWLLKVKE